MMHDAYIWKGFPISELQTCSSFSPKPCLDSSCTAVKVSIPLCVLSSKKSSLTTSFPFSSCICSQNIWFYFDQIGPLRSLDLSLGWWLPVFLDFLSHLGPLALLCHCDPLQASPLHTKGTVTHTTYFFPFMKLRGLVEVLPLTSEPNLDYVDVQSLLPICL